MDDRGVVKIEIGAYDWVAEAKQATGEVHADLSGAGINRPPGPPLDLVKGDTEGHSCRFEDGSD